MRRILYFDAAAGASGDMVVGALLDLGAPFPDVAAHVTSLGIPVAVGARRVTRAGVAATKFDVVDPATGRAVDAPVAAHTQGHRGLREIRRLLERAPLPPAVAAAALGVFERLAAAEARVHGTSVDEVHFHEVGALDAIADVVAAASAFVALRVDEAHCSPVHLGAGTVRCAHGVLPVPAPATAELLRAVPTYSDGTPGELTTPTGAALLTHFCASFGARPPLRTLAQGCGAGTRDPVFPNVLRAVLGATCGATIRGVPVAR